MTIPSQSRTRRDRHSSSTHAPPSFQTGEKFTYQKPPTAATPSEILKTSECFWATFCQQAKINSDLFSIKLTENAVEITGGLDTVHDVYGTVEKIRQIFLAAFDEKKPIALLLNEQNGFYFLQRRVAKLESNQLLSATKIPVDTFNELVLPCLNGLAQALGCECEKIKVTQLMQSDTSDEKRMDALCIEWKSPYHNLHCLYEKQDHSCDVSVEAKDGVIRAHSAPLKALRLLAPSQTSLNLNSYSLETVKALLDFCYVGPKGIPLTSIKANSSLLSDLFKIAYDINSTPLIEHCIHLATHAKGKIDGRELYRLGKEYKIPKLIELAQETLKSLQKK